LSEIQFALTRLFPFIGFQIITEPGSLEDLPCLERDKHLSDKANLTDFTGIATTNSGFFPPRARKVCDVAWAGQWRQAKPV
jgi:hypothetical protein